MNTGAVNQAASVAAETVQNTTKKTEVSGKKIGKPELSEKAAKYYEKLKAKFHNMDFILVSKDMKEQAEANASKYANGNKTVVLIDDEKIERMAEDEEYRKKYEGIISNAAAQIAQMSSSFNSASGVTSYGIKVNDNGTASFFAVVDKSLAAQKERIEKHAEKKAADKKKAAKEEAADKAEKKKAEKAEAKKTSEKDEVTITASSVEELIEKLNSPYYIWQANDVMTDAEKKVGQHFDMNV